MGFAVLRANYNASATSYLEGFQPFILSVLAEASSPHLERETIANAIQMDFGISIPSLVVKNLLRLMYKRGLTENIGPSAVALTAIGMESAPALQQQVAQYNQRQAELVSTFMAFTKERYPDKLRLVSSAAAALLADYFARHAAPLLNVALRGRRDGNAPQPGIDFLVASFVTHLAANDQTRFGYVVEAAKGAMLSAVLLLDTSGLNESLSSLTLVIDTPVLMDSLGFHGGIQQMAATQLISLALNQSAKVVTFDHSVNELDGILEHIAQALRKGNRSRSTSTGYLHFVDQGASPVDVVLLQQKLPELLAEARIEIVSRPDGYYEFGLDEDKLEELIQSKVNYFQDSARANDVKSLSATHRLRKGKRDRSLERCKAVLVTSNANLVLGAIGFEDGQLGFPLAITTDAVASVLWVRSPSALPDAPRERLLAAAYAGMQPSPATWTKYLDEIDILETQKTVSADEAIILRTSRVSRESLMEETLGQSDAVSAESPMVALERIKKEATAPFEEQVRDLRARASQADTTANTASADWIEQVEARERAESELKKLRLSEADSTAELTAVRSGEATKVENIRKRARIVARRSRLLLVWAVRLVGILISVWAIAVFLALPDPADSTGIVIVGVAGLTSVLMAFIPPLQRPLDVMEHTLAILGARRRLVNLGYSAETLEDYNSASGREDTRPVGLGVTNANRT
ncbi:hypothetical protein E3T26_01930 [Cryobacterium sp. TMT1-21]|uniref:hypothetical protein n=1 Tax=Cryobacterium sp. TMT1-21 TaxID=1259234 RepID=UPI00106C2B75|nr:hypothetical protein [Cryobacterium sp. TMT1-21]TFD17551.1 hypothetical protein E3T26_01930 [Cryobacterium sp. TMT1-21]